VLGTGKFQRVERSPFYTKTWFIVGVGIAAVLVGTAIGFSTKPDFIYCSGPSPDARCQ
jgi:hypothetical protein